MISTNPKLSARVGVVIESRCGQLKMSRAYARVFKKLVINPAYWPVYATIVMSIFKSMTCACGAYKMASYLVLNIHSCTMVY